ncbi:MAG TPA: hypothetical protein VFL93_14630 [Longimicrobiaceae bacterium]|nr:hypothetical protein [Longimicrobiaceae bacterium]
MMLAAVLLLTQVLAPPHQVAPVLQFPEPGMDDPAAYQGYGTRFYRDASGNTVQVYLDQRDGRVVSVWADAADESLGFTVRDGSGATAALAWDGATATVDADGPRRSVQYRLRVGGGAVEIGRFLLGSMRLERDFQYTGGHRQPMGAPPFPRPELDTLIADLERLDAPERARQLALLRAHGVDDLRARVQPTLTVDSSASGWRVRVEHLSFDGRNRQSLELRFPRGARVRRTGSYVTVRSPGGEPLPLTVRVETDAAPLTPLRAEEIFDAPFLAYLRRLRAEGARIEAVDAARRSAAQRERLHQVRRTERQVLSLELLSSHEKLMAGLPNYGTYFGRDMLMTALLMEPVWAPRMSEYVIGAALRKLSPDGQVSHEEALGGQAIRENAGVYDDLMAEYFRRRGAGETAAADSALARARAVLSDLQAVRENYHMMDDDFQLPVLVAHYLARTDVPAEQKRAFLLASAGGKDGASRLTSIVRNLDHVARMARPYARDPVASNLVGFPRLDSTGWLPASWRDSRVGYANGRYAMDINVVWVPHALQALGEIGTALRGLGFDARRLAAAAPEVRDSALGEYLGSPAALQAALQRWRGASRHFEVALAPGQVRERVEARLRAMPAGERHYWSDVFQRSAPGDTLRFLALSLDSLGHPVPVVNTDVAMHLFLGAGALPPEQVLRELRPVMLAYPAGLFIPGLGPVVANDAYADSAVWQSFVRDQYHSPRVVWGREVNFLMMALARQIEAATDGSGIPLRPALAPYVDSLRTDLRRTRDAVAASGLSDQELWTYRIDGDRLLPVRYATSTDLQLWNLTGLAVQYELARLPVPARRRAGVARAGSSAR